MVLLFALNEIKLINHCTRLCVWRLSYCS